MGKFISFQIFFLILANSLMAGVYSTTFTFVNKCQYTVWPGLLSNAGIAPLPTTGFVLNSGDSREIAVPSAWAGRFWGRTLCSEDSTNGNFVCKTGDCGSGKLECIGLGAVPPATLAEFTLDGAGGQDFYDVSLVDGYNLPMLVVPRGGSGDNCTSTGCVADLNGACPSDLRVDGGIACRSACERFGTEEYCCSGAYGTPDACKPSHYSMVFKSACPRAYSYAYDDRTSTFTCTGADYTLTFCPSPNTSQKSSGGPNPGSDEGGNGNSDGNSNGNSNTPFDGNMVYEGAYDTSAASSSTCAHVLGLAVAFAAAIWRLSHHHLD